MVGYLRAILILAALAVPVSLSSFLVQHHFDAHYDQFAPEGLADLNGDYPLLWSDELQYWHEILTFSTHGLSGGYYTFNEKVPPVGLFHFGPHGPVFPMVYGTLGHLFGWHYYSAPLFNTVFLTGAIAIFIFLIRPDIKQSLWIFVLLSCFWPMLLFIPSGMQESLHQSLAIVLAGLSFTLMREDPAWKIYGPVLVVLLSIAALLRPTWSLLLLPLLFLIGNTTSFRRLIILSCIASAISAAVFLIYVRISAPYPYNFLSSLKRELAISLFGGLKAIFTHFVSNAASLFRLDEKNALVLLQRYQIVLLLVVCVYSWFRGVRASRKSGSLHSSIQDNRTWLFHVMNLGLPLLFILFFYDMYFFRDYRIMAPHLLLSLFVLIAQRRFWMVAVVTALFLVLFPAFNSTYEAMHQNHFAQEQDVLDRFRNNVSRFVEYRESGNAWCNSLLADVNYYPLLKTLPAGIGLGATFGWDKNDPPYHSRYLLLLPGDAIANATPVRLLNSSDFGNLYVNTDVRCEGDLPHK